MLNNEQVWAFIKKPGIRWFLAASVLVLTWLVLSPTWMIRSVVGKDFINSSQMVVESLENKLYRAQYFGSYETKPDCPGASCPLDLAVDLSTLPVERGLIGVLRPVVNQESWRGTMYQRWDIKVPMFVQKPGDPIVFDFLGISGKSWRFYVNGVQMAQGFGGMNLPAITFPSPGQPGTPMVIGFEVNIGRSLAPGVVTISQPFLSIPGVSEKFRLAYRGLDGMSTLPVALAYAFIATLAAFACFFTPFYREILAFAIYVTVANWRVLLFNGFSMIPSVFNVDILAFDGMLRCISHAALWSFWGLYFRVNSPIKWLPMAFYATLLPVCYLAGRFGYGLDILMFLFDTSDIQNGLAYSYGMILAVGTWHQVRGVAWAKFRRAMTILVTLLCGLLAATFISRQYFSTQGTFQDMLVRFPFYEFMILKNLHIFVGVMSLAIALEWSIIVRDRQKILQKFGMLVDPRLVNNIIRGQHGDSRRLDQVVILFADLRSFTAMCDVFSPDKVTECLNEYLDIVMNAVGKHGGVVDKIVGDAVMAVWGVPDQTDSDAIAACRAAVDIRIGLAALNERRLQQGNFALGFGIGIHRGPAIFGAIGNGVRVDHTVIGPSINIASRLQSLTKLYGCDILISNDLLATVEGGVIVEDLGLVRIRGVARQIGVAKVLGVADRDGVMLIGHPLLEKHLTSKRPGSVSSIPPHSVMVDYATDHIKPQSDAESIAS
jgi:class 3 adenylate cyclase